MPFGYTIQPEINLTVSILSFLGNSMVILICCPYDFIDSLCRHPAVFEQSVLRHLPFAPNAKGRNPRPLVGMSGISQCAAGVFTERSEVTTDPRLILAFARVS